MRRSVLLAEIEVTPPAVEPLLASMAALAARGHGWVNLQPAIPEEAVPPPPRGAALLLASSSDPVPVCSWVVGGPGRRQPAKPDQLGIQHGAGAPAIGRLAAAGVQLPPGWRCRQDHPRRGVVVDVPAGTDPGQVVAWLVAAGTVLATVPLAGPWRGRVHGAPDTTWPTSSPSAAG